MASLRKAQADSPTMYTRWASQTMMNDVILSVGSNINPVENLRRASEILAQEYILVACSRSIVTAAVGFPDQPDFLNAAFFIQTELDQPTLNQALKRIETQLGRVKTAIKTGSHPIDLDIVVWNGQIVRDEFYHHRYVSDPIYELVHQHSIALKLT